MFRPKTALLCGASRGIGAAVLSLLPQIYPLQKIFAVSRSGTVDVDIDEIYARFGCRIFPIQCNMVQEEDLERLYTSIQEHTRQLQLVINTVGFLSNEHIQPEKNLRSVSPENLAYSIQRNTWPALGLTKHLRPLLRHKEPTRMVFFSARVGSVCDNGLGGWYSYRISKAALNMAVRCISIELGRNNPNLCCYSYHPGTVDTDLSRPFTRRYTKNAIFSAQQAAEYVLNVLAARNEEDNGGFFDWKGEPIPF